MCYEISWVLGKIDQGLQKRKHARSSASSSSSSSPSSFSSRASSLRSFKRPRLKKLKVLNAADANAEVVVVEEEEDENEKEGDDTDGVTPKPSTARSSSGSMTPTLIPASILEPEAVTEPLAHPMDSTKPKRTAGPDAYFCLFPACKYSSRRKGDLETHVKFAHNQHARRQSAAKAATTAAANSREHTVNWNSVAGIRNE